MTFSTLTQSGSGASIRVENNAICALIGGLSPAGAAQTEVVTRERVANIFIASSVAATLAALSAPVPATVLLTQADGVLTCRIVPGGVDEIKPLGSANSTIVLLDGTVVDVVGTPTVVAALLDAVTYSAGRVVLEAYLISAAISPQQSDYDITLGFDPAYVPGSANYTFEMTGADVPTNYQVVATQISGEACVLFARPTVLGAPTFVVAPVAASRVRGGGPMSNAGVLGAGDFGIAGIVHNGPGIYTVTATVTTRPSQLQAVAAETTAFIATVTTTSDGVFVVRTFDAAGVAADAACTLSITALEGADGQVSIPTECNFAITIISLDA